MGKKGLLFVISGPSGVGKGTVCKAFLEKHPEVFLSVSATTRAPRPGEKDGVNYYFLSQEEFRSKIAADGFLEHAVFCENYYGTPRDKVLQKLDEGTDVILEIEVQGALQVRSHYPEAVFIFVLTPTLDELERRLRTRGTETEEVIRERLLRAREEIRLADKYNYLLINDNLSEAVTELENIVSADKCVIARNWKFIEEEFINK